MCGYDSKSGACQGDSGGPMMSFEITGKPSRTKTYLIGVVSYGNPKCGDKK